MALVEFLFRWFHVLSGIVWIGLLYYFNFVQGEYFKNASVDAKADATAHLVPRALGWFRWGALVTFITGLYLLHKLGSGANQYILLGSVMGILMFLNVWLIIWPAQKIVIGRKDGDVAAAATRALRASRTNTLFSAPMLYGMLASKHGTYSANGFAGIDFGDLGFVTPLVILFLLQVNALLGRTGPMTSVVGVVHLSLALTALLFGLVHFF